MGKQQKFTGAGLLWDISKGSRLLLLFSLLLMALAIFANYLVPQIVLFVIDCILGGKPMTQPKLVQDTVLAVGGVQYLGDNIVLVALVLFAISAVGGLATFGRGKAVAVGSESMIYRLRTRVFSHISELPYSWHVNIQTGDVIQRCTADIDVVRGFIATQLLEMVRTVLLVFFAYSILFRMNFTMALYSFLFLPVIVLYSFLFLSKVSSRYLAADESEGVLYTIAQENLNGVRVVRAFGREQYETARFKKQNYLFSQLWMQLGKLLSLYWSVGDFLIGLQMLTLCIVGAFQASSGNLTVGEFVVFLSYNSMLIWPVRALGRVLSESSKTGVSLERIAQLLREKKEIDPEDSLTTPIDGDIIFDNVHFKYDNLPVLDGVSFTIKKGETLGILGETGAGKTTIAHLLCRLHDLPESDGSITIGGVNILKYNRKWLRQNVGIVLQEPFLYSRTIAENIASLSQIQTKEIHSAARDACVHDSIVQFAHGYDTMVGERGVTLSGGQKQRVAIARTILKQPPIIIFDDSLSAVDTETDHNIRIALAKRVQGTTTIIIAHRITTILAADKILVLSAGRVAEFGSHQQLMELGGDYHRIYNMQQSIL